MGKLLILSITDGEEQLLDKLKDFLAEAPGIEIVEPPATKHTLTFPGLELHLRKQTVKWRGRSLHLTHLEFFTLAYLARRPGWVFTQEQIYEAVWHEFPEHCGAARPRWRPERTISFHSCSLATIFFTPTGKNWIWQAFPSLLKRESCPSSIKSR